MDYDFGFFLLTLKAVDRLRKDMIVTQAAAIAAALGGKDAIEDILKD